MSLYPVLFYARCNESLDMYLYLSLRLFLSLSTAIKIIIQALRAILTVLFACDSCSTMKRVGTHTASLANKQLHPFNKCGWNSCPLTWPSLGNTYFPAHTCHHTTVVVLVIQFCSFFDTVYQIIKTSEAKFFLSIQTDSIVWSVKSQCRGTVCQFISN